MSDDLISRKRVLDEFEEMNAISFYTLQEDSREAYYELRQVVEQTPSVDHIGDSTEMVSDKDPHTATYIQALKNRIKELEADRPKGEWIPCSERMPEYRKTVLISTFWGVKTGFLDSTEAYGDFWEIIEDEATAALHSIYAWMPLPEPWKGADDE